MRVVMTAKAPLCVGRASRLQPRLEALMVGERYAVPEPTGKGGDRAATH